MYRAFALDISNNLGENELIFAKKYDAVHSEVKNIDSKLSDFIFEKNGQKSINANALQAYDFPIDKYDIFFSFAHEDTELAKVIAYKIEQATGLRCFVDCDIWGAADRTIDAIYKQATSANNQITTPQNDYNYTASHVYALLYNAILKMINQCEVVFFLKTDNFLKNNAIVHSPWIFNEIEITRTMRRRIPSRFRYVVEVERDLKMFSESRGVEDRRPYDVEYGVNINDFDILSREDIKNWLSDSTVNEKQKLNNLDLLYQTHPTSDITLVSSKDENPYKHTVNGRVCVYYYGENLNISL